MNLREALEKHSDNEILQVGNHMRLEERNGYRNQKYRIVEFLYWYEDGELKIKDSSNVNLSKPEILAIADRVERKDE